MKNENASCSTTIDIAEQDVIAAMKDIQGYIDISPGDFREVFQVAYKHALQRIWNSRVAQDMMTQPVQCLGADIDLIQAATFLAEKRFSGAPVVDTNGSIVGVLSEKDFLAQMGLAPPSPSCRLSPIALPTRDAWRHLCVIMPFRKS